MYYRSKRKKTAEYLAYQEEVRDELMGVEWSFGNEPVTFIIRVGFSSKVADLDNIMKPLFDTFQVIFDDFNDNKVYRIEAEKEIVDKGKEYLHVRIVQNELP